MKSYLIGFLTSLLLIIGTMGVSAQENNFDELSRIPKDTTVDFPLDYKIARPRTAYPH
ncbi:hypothetical protein [Chitinophaga sp. Ak27]|nr:hypothetical protein [Chitinophaga sp. Ak27]NLU93316.1 hypothetical protein [Chitinophaga sp. Ak27]